MKKKNPEANKHNYESLCKLEKTKRGNHKRMLRCRLYFSGAKKGNLKIRSSGIDRVDKDYYGNCYASHV